MFYKTNIRTWNFFFFFISIRTWNLKQEKIKHLCFDGEDCPDHQAPTILISFSMQEEVEEGLKACSLQVESLNDWGSLYKEQEK